MAQGITKQPRPTYEASDRLDYLRGAYTIYTGHINQMFNFFMLGVGLLGNAIVQMMNPTWNLPSGLPMSAAIAGTVLSFIFFGIHKRSRQILDTVEARLMEQEKLLFEGSSGFLISLPDTSCFGKLRFLFPAAYATVAFGFLSTAIYLLVRCRS